MLGGQIRSLVGHGKGYNRIQGDPNSEPLRYVVLDDNAGWLQEIHDSHWREIGDLI